MYHFQQFILPQFSSNPILSPNILPIQSHFNKYSDLYIPSKSKPQLKSNPSISSFSVLTPTKKTSSKYLQQQQYYTKLFHQMQGSTEEEITNHLQEMKEIEEEILSVKEENLNQVITTNTIYNMFINERKEIMKNERDERVEREKEKEIERKGTSFSNGKTRSNLRNTPNSPTHFNRGMLRGGENRDYVFEKRVVEFDKLSDMMIQV